MAPFKCKATWCRHDFPYNVAFEVTHSMKPRLLIVDDDEELRTQMKWALSSQYELFCAEDRAGALQMFSSNRPVVTLLDLGLPPSCNNCDEGLATLSELLAIDETAKNHSHFRTKREEKRASGRGQWRLRLLV